MFEELRTFLEVAESKNFTKTAKKLNFSQPTISQQVKKVEIYFNNITLLTRSPNTKQIELTPEGQIVYQKAKEILALVDSAFAELDLIQNEKTKILHIGASMTIGNFMLPKVLKAFSDRYPEVHLNICIENTFDICKKMENGEIDIGLIEGKNIEGSFLRSDFLEDKLILVASPGTATSVTDFSASQLAKLSWLTREKGSGTEQYLRSFIESNQIKAANQIVYNSNYAIKEAVKEGMGITLISQMVVNDELASGELVKLPLNKKYTRNLSYILPEGFSASQPVLDFIEVLLRVSKEFHYE